MQILPDYNLMAKTFHFPLPVCILINPYTLKNIFCQLKATIRDSGWAKGWVRCLRKPLSAVISTDIIKQSFSSQLDYFFSRKTTVARSLSLWLFTHLSKSRWAFQKEETFYWLRLPFCRFNSLEPLSPANKNLSKILTWRRHHRRETLLYHMIKSRNKTDLGTADICKVIEHCSLSLPPGVMIFLQYTFWNYKSQRAVSIFLTLSERRSVPCFKAGRFRGQMPYCLSSTQQSRAKKKGRF